MISMILCWVLFAKGIIDLALPIISTILFVFSGTIKIVIYAND